MIYLALTHSGGNYLLIGSRKLKVELRSKEMERTRKDQGKRTEALIGSLEVLFLRE